MGMGIISRRGLASGDLARPGWLPRQRGGEAGSRHRGGVVERVGGGGRWWRIP